jgi:diguanylate cyclase
VLGLIAEALLMYHALQVRSRQRAATETRLQDLGLADALTGLTPQELAADQVDALLDEQLARMGAGVPLLYVRLDNMAELSREHGHEVADRALLLLARVLSAQRSDGDVAARLGIDSLLLAAHEPLTEFDLRNIATQMMAKILTPNQALAPHIKPELRIALGLAKANGTKAVQVFAALKEHVDRAQAEGHKRRIDMLG